MGKPYEIGVSPDGSYIFTRAFQKPYTMELALELATELIQFGGKLSVVGCLIDVRGTTSVSSVVDKYQFAYEQAPAIGLPHHWRISFLIDHNDNSPDFIETVMKNAGYQFQVFKDECKAIDWLKEA